MNLLKMKNPGISLWVDCSVLLLYQTLMGKILAFTWTHILYIFLICLKVQCVRLLIVEFHSQVVQYRRFRSVAGPNYQPNASVFEDPWMRFSILQMAPLSTFSEVWKHDHIMQSSTTLHFLLQKAHSPKIITIYLSTRKWIFTKMLNMLEFKE